MEGKLKKSLCLKFLAFCMASAGFMCVKSSMPSVEVYAMEGLQNKAEVEYNRLPALRADFGNLNYLWRGNIGHSAIDEIESLLEGETPNVDVIQHAISAIRDYLDKYRYDRVKDWTFACWGDLLLLGKNYPNVVIHNQQVIALLMNLRADLVNAGVIEDSEEYDLSFIPQVE